MPLHKVIYLSNNTKLYLWKITENLESLSKDVRLKDSTIQRLKSMKSESHKKGFMAVRKLLEHIDYNDFDLFYDAFGKPHLEVEGQKSKDKIFEREIKKYISISHSHDFSCICISNKPVGIDIEKQRDKILRIAHKFTKTDDYQSLNHQDSMIRKLTIVWCAKESLYKSFNRVGLTFLNHQNNHYDSY